MTGSGKGVARLLARLAVAAALGTLLVLVLALREGGLLILGAGLLGLVVCAAGLWWFLAHRGAMRLFGALVAVAAPVAVLVYFAYDGLWLAALVLILCWGVTLVCARAALREAVAARPRRAIAAARPRRPVLIMNPKSGGGKVGRFGLVERAEELGARVHLLDPSAPADVGELARRAVADGADLLGVAGGDGTQALVAAVAAEHDLPFLVVCAGTRNHFAMDLGLDRADPARCLDALTDGEELRVDLGDVAGRAFVNTVSFGVYADVVQRPEYRDDKAGTALSLMPDLLVGEGVRRLDARADTTALSSQQALLVSNNPYGSPDDPGASGRRPRLDGGELGVLALRVEGAAQAADLAVRGSQSTGLTAMTARRVEVTSDADEIPVAVDGEALRMPTPVVCTLRPGALRVLVPRDRPDVVTPAPPMNWRRLIDLAFGGRESHG
ncbi:diacylglycerol/lipid kinase family protein [Streptomyces sp. NRRL B-1347]|uniref:diacylglycerol/lipid kinase family protein n=1 Tax=Streptomyces sp. NRRL B-1347 TaxID=1476877 RepID=UPI0004CA5935|nr:diacylglycerol kinase family protein [Streptomyces sp. NRRL B-1347]